MKYSNSKILRKLNYTLDKHTVHEISIRINLQFFEYKSKQQHQRAMQERSRVPQSQEIPGSSHRIQPWKDHFDTGSSIHQDRKFRSQDSYRTIH